MSMTSASGLLSLSSSLLVLSCVTVVLRFYTRQKQRLEIKADDWIMLPCLVSDQLLQAIERADRCVCSFFSSQQHLPRSMVIPNDNLGLRLDLYLRSS